MRVFIDRSLCRNRGVINVICSAHYYIVAYHCGPFCAFKVCLIDVPGVRVAFGTKNPLFQNNASIQLFSKPLQNASCFWIIMVYFPKAWRAATVFLLVIMMKRPDTIMAGFQNFA